jgi:WD40 repeat protein
LTAVSEPAVGAVTPSLIENRQNWVDARNSRDFEVHPMATLVPDKIKVVKDIPRKEIVFALARKPRTGCIFFGGSDFAVSEMDLEKSKPEAKELGRHDSYVTSVALAGSILVSGGYDGRLIWWNIDSESQLRSVDAHRKWIRDVVATPDGTIVASVADDMVCRLWEVSSGRLIRALHGHAEMTPHDFASMLYACAVSCDGRLLATGDKVGHVKIWEIESGRAVASVDAPVMYTWDPVQRRHSIGGIRALAFSPDGTQLAVGGIGTIGNIDHLEGKPRVEVFDWKQGKRIGEFSGERKGLVEHLEFHPKGDWLLAAGGYSDGFLLFVDVAGKKIITQRKLPMYVHDLTLSEEIDKIYAAGHHKLAILAT